MPHRRTPRGYAINLLQRGACFDLESKESINQLPASSIVCSVEQEFPGVDAQAVLSAEGLDSGCLIRGLVLRDRYGGGALQGVVLPKPLSVSEFMVLQREEARRANGAL